MPHTIKQFINFDEIAKVPMPGDNAAIASCRLAAGTSISYGTREFILTHTILEGHRFAIAPIANGEGLLSWGLPFGTATAQIKPGNYVCNKGMLEALQRRQLDFKLPETANFKNQISPYNLDENKFQPAAQVPLHKHSRTFMGYDRSASRGVGTRNFIVLLGTSSRTSAYVKCLEEHFNGVSNKYKNIDGIVAVTHTEGAGQNPNNRKLLLRTLAGFMVHSNVGAVLAVDYGDEGVTNKDLTQYMHENYYPLNDVIHNFFSLKSGFINDFKKGAAIVKEWLDPVNSISRTAQSVAHLKVALQCGGSDAFSGISGNPLVGFVTQEIIQYGGSANLAETTELIGGESYVLKKVKDINTARKFLNAIEDYKDMAAKFGHTAEGNVTGGNKLRGLYNIVLKSMGAARKRAPNVRLDAVIDYSEQMSEPGFFFMDSPGNDIESIAGQVAAGCNMILFVTGNGSITNFPFAPTIKVVTTTTRYDHLSEDMDVNAGAYLDEVPMETLGRKTLDLTIDIASGKQSIGEKAGHSQVQIWRDWPNVHKDKPENVHAGKSLSGSALSIVSGPIISRAASIAPDFTALKTDRECISEQVGLILPNSLCAAQVALMAASNLNKKQIAKNVLSRYVALEHSEGCGSSVGLSEEIYVRTMLGYLAHPMVKHSFLLELGCEKTHNDFMRLKMKENGMDPQDFGWASIQLDGGTSAVLKKIETWFEEKSINKEMAAPVINNLSDLSLGLITSGTISTDTADTLLMLTKTVVDAGGTIIIPHQSELLKSSIFISGLLNNRKIHPTLAYGQKPLTPGFHIMEIPFSNQTETLSGLGASGANVFVAYAGEQLFQGHPMIPVIQISDRAAVIDRYEEDLDLILTDNKSVWTAKITELIQKTMSMRYSTKLQQQGNIGFQITRGLFGISI